MANMVVSLTGYGKTGQTSLWMSFLDQVNWMGRKSHSKSEQGYSMVCRTGWGKGKVESKLNRNTQLSISWLEMPCDHLAPVLSIIYLFCHGELYSWTVDHNKHSPHFFHFCLFFFFLNKTSNEYSHRVAVLLRVSLKNGYNKLGLINSLHTKKILPLKPHRKLMIFPYPPAVNVCSIECISGSAGLVELNRLLASFISNLNHYCLMASWCFYYSIWQIQ